MSELALQLIEKEKQEKTGKIDLGKCGLTNFPNELFELKCLEELSMSNKIWNENDQEWIESDNKGPDNYLECNLPDKFQTFESLKNVSISGDYRRHFNIKDTAVLYKISGLQTLDLRYNQISDISFLEKLTKLKYLDLRGNKISDISCLAKLRDLEILHFSSNQTSNYSVLEKLTKLHVLDLRSNQISDIGFLENLTDLQMLRLSNNQIRDIRSLEKLIRLHYVDLSLNWISDVSILEKLTAIQTLKLSNNRIRDIHLKRNFTDLQTLYLNGNKIRDIRFREKLTKLKYLDLSFNEISDFAFLEKLTNLQYLGLRKNMISDIRFGEKLAGLQSLNLSRNNITDMTFLEKLTGLHSLYLRSNNLSDISFLEKSTGLQTLDLIDNQIRDITPLKSLLEKGISVTMKDKGNGIMIGKNPLTVPPIEIVKQGTEAVLRYLEELHKEQVISLNEAKLLIIGAGGVGKTSFMTKLNDTEAELPVENDTTIGITVSQTPIKFSIDGQECILNIWDFGGQDIYHPTHQFFLTKNSIYILIQDGREQKTDFYYWLQVQELLASNSPLYIIQNIKNNNRCSIPINELKAKFENIKDYFELDLAQVVKGHKEFENIERILKTTHQRLPQIGEPWPARRFAIRDELIALRERNFIEYNEYQEICNNHNYSDPQGQKELAQQLHDLGNILHFQNTPALEDIVITNPQWATDAVYEILNHTKDHYKKQGHFTWKDLKEVWTDKKYKGVYLEILTLMEKFELCFEIPEEKYTYIAPLLLPDDQPQYDWNDQGNLQMMYSYDFMPKGIMARLMVKLHTRIRENLFWKRGMVLEHQDTFAQVSEDYTSRNIAISVNGEHAKELIFTIYSAIDEINSSYYFSDRMKASKLVPCNCEECHESKRPNFYDFELLQMRIRKNKQTIECAISFKDVNVRSLLDYITPNKTKEDSPAQLFISYAHIDKSYKDKLEIALAVQRRMNKVQVWSDEEIHTGAQWNDEIESHLKRADIIVLLLSPDFFHSDYIWDKERPIVNERYEAKAAKVVPILLRECDWGDSEYSKIQAVPTEPESRKLLPISKWEDPDTAWNIVVSSIKKLI